MRHGTLVIGVLFTLVAAFLMGMTLMEPAPAVDDTISPKRISLIFLGLLGCFGILLSVRAGRDLLARPDHGQGQAPNIRLCAFMLLCLTYVGALSLIGHFLPCTILLLLAGLLLLNVKRSRAVPISIGFPCVTWAVFKLLLGVPLP